MYRWRRMTDEQRREILLQRRIEARPWHSPPHLVAETTLYLITAACYEHKPHIGHSAERMVAFEQSLQETLNPHCREVFAWTVLPNHYHVLVDTPDVKALLSALGRLHGRTSYTWNLEENCRGRKVWFNLAETAMKSDRHFWATLNYVLHNAVRHGYVARWTDWPHSNARDYIDAIGREEATRVWREYPILDYGADWDPPDL